MDSQGSKVKMISKKTMCKRQQLLLVSYIFFHCFFFLCKYNGHCLSLFSAAVTEYHRPDNLQRIKVYLTHSSGGWEIQEHITSSDKSFLAVSQHSRRNHMVKQRKHPSWGFSPCSEKATNAIIGPHSHDLI
jgi:hypothetical protein